MERKENKKVVIIGNGIAGVSAAEAMRKKDESVQITLLDGSDYPVYYKPMLSKFIGKGEVPKAFFMHDKAWYESLGIDFVAPVKVTAIHPEERVLDLSDGGSMHYDELIIAVGSECFVPPIENNHLEGVYTLRTYDDANEIKERMTKSSHAVVIGGGLLGLEAAAQMHHGGMEVTVVEIMDRLLPRQLDEKGAKFLEEAFSVDRMSIVKGEGVTRLIGDREVTGVLLDDGNEIKADIVLISAGVRTDVSMFEAIGMECNRGIVVNSHMATNIPHIYACGDCASFEGMNYAIWPEAVLQGQIAGSNVVGEAVEYDAFIPSTILNAMGLSIFSIGEIKVPDRNQIAVLEYDDPVNRKYKRLNFKEDELIGGIIVGDNRKSRMMINGMKEKKNLTQMLEVLE